MRTIHLLRRYTLLAAAFLLAALVSLPSLAQDFEVDGIYYNITSASDFTVEVTNSTGGTRSSNSYFGSVTISASVTYNSTTYAVTSIGDFAFYDCPSLTSITIPEGVTSIGYEAFYDCKSLTSIIIPEGFTSIGDAAFASCKSLTSITIPEGVTSIGGTSAFAFCESLTSITIPEGVTSIGDYAFYRCTGLTSITIPNSVKSIGQYAFWNCLSLTSITIPESVTSIGDYAFSGCTSLASITIPNSVTSIGSSTFSGCSSLTSITIPASVTSIGFRAFYNCTSLTEMTCLNPEPPTCVSSTFFTVDTEACVLIVPSGAVEAYAAADYWEAFTNIVGVGNPFERDGIYYVLTSEEDSTLTVTNVDSNVYSGAIVIPDSVELGRTYAVTSIADSTFAGCAELTSVAIPASVTSIGVDAFAGSTSLFSVEKTDSTLYTLSFKGASSIAGNCESGMWLEDGTFAALSEDSIVTFTELTPDSTYTVTYGIRFNEALFAIGNLTAMTKDYPLAFHKDGLAYVVTSVDDMTAEVTKADTLYSGAIVIPESVELGRTYAVTSIADSTFAGCAELTSVTIPASVTSIGAKAFAGSTGLMQIEVADSTSSSLSFLATSSISGAVETGIWIGGTFYAFTGDTLMVEDLTASILYTVAYGFLFGETEQVIGTLEAATTEETATGISSLKVGADAIEFRGSLTEGTLEANVTSASSSEVAWAVYALNGRRVAGGTVTADGTWHSLSTGALARGTYLLRIGDTSVKLLAK